MVVAGLGDILVVGFREREGRRWERENGFRGWVWTGLLTTASDFPEVCDEKMGNKGSANSGVSGVAVVTAKTFVTVPMPFRISSVRKFCLKASKAIPHHANVLAGWNSSLPKNGYWGMPQLALRMRIAYEIYLRNNYIFA